MKAKSGESAQLVDQLAKTAHEMIDRVQERAAQMEENIGKQSKETGKRVVAGIEREVSGLEKYIEENPMMATMIAFGIGAFASRIIKASGMTRPEAVSAKSASSKKTEEASIGEAA